MVPGDGELVRAMLSASPASAVASALQWFTVGLPGSPATTPARLAEASGKAELNYSMLQQLARQYLLDCGVRFAMYRVLLKGGASNNGASAAQMAAAAACGL